MNIYPAMDLIKGSCVRLTKGKFDQVTDYRISPLEQAQAFADAGAKFLHIVDLDGAKDSANRQSSLIREIAQNSTLKIQVGGGVRTEQDVAELLNQGVQRVIIGSLAVKNQELTKKILKVFGGDAVVLAFDIKITDRAYVTHGAWEETSSLALEDLVESYMEYGIKSVLCTDIDRDGTLTSPNFELYQDMKSRYPDLEWIASGGVSSIEDLQKLLQLGLDSVVLGKALYENRVDLKEALNVG